MRHMKITINVLLASKEDAKKLFEFAKNGIKDMYPVDGEVRNAMLKWLEELKEGMGTFRGINV